MTAPVQIMTHEFAPFRGGIGVYVEETALALSLFGAETTVWAPDYGEKQDDAYPFAVRRIPMRGKQDWGCRFRLARAIKRAYPAGIIPGTLVLAEPGPIRLWMYRKWLRLPRPERLSIILHGSEIQLLTRSDRRRGMLQRLLEEADLIGVVSEDVLKSMLRSIPDLVGRMSLVPGAIRSAWAELPPAERPQEDAPIEILQVGRIHPRKGQLVLVEAASQLAPAMQEQIRIRLAGPVGKPAYAKKIMERIRETGVPVVLDGALSEDELRDAYCSATMVIMPSQPYGKSVEGLGLALLEGQHFGRPVIGTRTGGIAEALLENETGLLVSPGNPVELAAAITYLLEHPDKCQQMGSAGTSFVRACFSWAENARKILGKEN